MSFGGVELIEATELYNLLNLGLHYPCLSDPNFLLLLDARPKEDYEESHVITAKLAHTNEDGSFKVPYDAELECKVNLVVYDGNTSSLKDDGPALSCAKVMWDMRSRHKVKILKGGYEDFSALYPFLRTQTIIYMPRELDEINTYPIEILPGFLYLGNWRQGNAAYIQKDLKIKGHVNCCIEEATFFKEVGPNLMHINVEDSDEADIHSKFEPLCEFLDGFRQRGEVALVFSRLALSRSAAMVQAYLIKSKMMSLQEAYSHITKCSNEIQPNKGFIKQLSEWEGEVHGQKITDIEDPNF